MPTSFEKFQASKKTAQSNTEASKGGSAYERFQASLKPTPAVPVKPVEKTLKPAEVVSKVTGEKPVAGALPSDGKKAPLQKTVVQGPLREPVAPKTTSAENKKAAMDRVTQIPLDTISTLRQGTSEFNTIFNDLKTYITQGNPERPGKKTSTARDVVTGAEAAGKLGKKAVETGFNVLKGWTNAFSEASDELMKDEIPSVKSQMFSNVAKAIDQTVGTTGDSLKRSFDHFNKADPTMADKVLGTLSGVTATIDVASSEVSDLLLPAAAALPGPAGESAKGFLGAIESFRDALAYSLDGYASLLPGWSDEEKAELAQSGATLMTFGAMVGGAGKAHKLGAAGVKRIISKVNEVKAKGAGKTDLGVAVSRAMEDATMETLAEDMPNGAATPAARAAANQPLDQGGAKQIRALTPRERFAFESETAGNIADDINSLSKKAVDDGIEVELSSMRESAAAEGVKVGTEDIPFNDYPATYDPTSNSIIFNYAKIRDHLETLARGDSIIYGRGAQQYVAKRKPGESFAEVSKRYLSELYEHELAHAKTVETKDMTALRDAEARGDKAAVKKIVTDLEERAHRFVKVAESKVLGEDITTAKADVLRGYEDVRMAKGEQKALRFADQTIEEGYQAWKRYASKQPGRENHTAEQVGKNLLKSRSKEFKTESEVFQRLQLERPMADASEVSLRPDDVIETYQKRFRQEKEIKERLDKSRETARTERETARAEREKAGENQPALPKSGITPAYLRRAVRDAKAEMQGKVKEAGRKGKAEGDIRVLLERGVEIARRKFAEAKLKDEFQRQKGNMKERAESKAAARKIVETFLRELKVPREERYRYINDILNATPENLHKKMDAIDRDYSVIERKRLRLKVQKQIKKKIGLQIETRTASGTRTSKMDAATVEMLREIKKNVKDGSYAEAFAERERIIGEYREKNPTGDIPEAIQDRLDVLSTYGIKDQSVSQLERTLEIIESLREEGKIKRAEQVDKLNHEALEAREEFIETAGIDPTHRPARAASGITAKALAGIKKYFIKSKAPEFLADFVSQKGEAYRSAISNLIREGSTRKKKARSMTRADEAKLGARLFEAYNLPKTKQGQTQLTKELGEIMLKEQNLGKFQGSAWANKDLVLTRGMAMDIISQSKNAATREILMNQKNGFTPEVLAKVEAMLTDSDKQMIEGLYELYQEKFPLLNETSAKDTGVYIGHISDHYIPRISKGEAASPAVLDEFLKRSDENRYSLRHASMKSRLETAGTIEFLDNPFSKYTQYASKANYYASMWDYAKTLDKVFDRSVMNGLEEKYGEGVVTGFKKYSEDIKRGGLERLGDNYQMILKLRNNVARALLNSPTVVAGQFSSTLQFAMENRSVGDYSKGMVEFFRNPVENGRAALEKSVTLQDRYDKKTFLAEATDLSKKASIRNIAGTENILDKLDIPLEKADMVTTVSGWHTVYKSWKKEFTKRGFDEAKAEELAIREADSSVERTQSSTDWMGKSQYESSQLGRLLISFVNQPIKQFNIMQHAILNAKKGRISKAEASKVLFTYGILIPALYATLQYEAKKGMNFVLGKEDDEEKLTDRIARTIITSPLGGMPVAGDLVKHGIDRAQGKNYEYSPSILYQPVKVGGSALFEASQGDTDEAITELLKLGAMVGGVGYAQAPLSEAKKKMGTANNERRAEERKTPEAKAAATQKRLDKKASEQK